MLATACAPLPHRETRAAHSSLGCIKTALRQHLPEGLPDAQAHCAAAGLIARYCSLTEATLASVGKELQDIMGPGDAQWRDLQSDRRGVDCARATTTHDALLKCCRETR